MMIVLHRSVPAFSCNQCFSFTFFAVGLNVVPQVQRILWTTMVSTTMVSTQMLFLPTKHGDAARDAVDPGVELAVQGVL
jgi:hypothetical protein